MFIRGQWLKLYATVAASLTVVFGFASNSPGTLNDVVWPVAYCLMALATLVLGFFPAKNTIMYWAGITIGTEALRAFVFAVQGFPNEGAGFTIHALIAMMAYVIWEGYRHSLPLEPEIQERIREL